MEKALPIALAVLLGLILTRSWAQPVDDKIQQQKTEMTAPIQRSDLDQLQKQTEELNFAASSAVTSAVQRKLNAASTCEQEPKAGGCPQGGK